LSSDNNIIIYSESGKIYNGELLEINEEAVIIDYEFNGKSGKLNIPRKSIARLFIEDEAMNDIGTKIDIYAKNFEKKGYQIKGIDFQQNILYIDSIYKTKDFEYRHVRDSIDISDSNLVRIHIIPKVPWGTGLIKSPMYGLFAGVSVGAFMGFIVGLDAAEMGFLFTMVGAGAGGVLGISMGLVVGILYIAGNLDNDVIIKAHPNMKDTMLRFIYYPDIRYRKKR
jgi:hypothetical protein